MVYVRVPARVVLGLRSNRVTNLSGLGRNLFTAHLRQLESGAEDEEALEANVRGLEDQLEAAQVLLQASRQRKRQERLEQVPAIRTLKMLVERAWKHGEAPEYPFDHDRELAEQVADSLGIASAQVLDVVRAASVRKGEPEALARELHKELLRLGEDGEADA